MLSRRQCSIIGGARMASLNVVVVSGNLTRDPEMTTLQSGTVLCKMRIAVNDRVKRNDEWQDRAHFFDVTAWAGVAENCGKYLLKGSGVMIRGKLQYEEWKAEDGTGRSRVAINAAEVIFMPKGSGEGGGGRRDERAPAADDDDIPFAFLDTFDVAMYS